MFFYLGPPLALPFFRGPLVPLSDLPLRFLTTLSLSTQDHPYIGGVVAEPKGLGNDLGHPGQGPQIRGIPVDRRPLQEQILLLCLLSGDQTRRSARGGSASVPPVWTSACNRLGDVGGELIFPATFLTPRASSRSATVRRRRASSATGFPNGLMHRNFIVPLFTQV